MLCGLSMRNYGNNSIQKQKQKQKKIYLISLGLLISIVVIFPQPSKSNTEVPGETARKFPHGEINDGMKISRAPGERLLYCSGLGKCRR